MATRKPYVLKHSYRCFDGKLTRKMGCFNANFSTPPLMMLVLKVMIPA